MSCTRPTRTPALRTGPRTLRPPILSKSASTRYVCVARSAPRLPTFRASTRRAANPAATNAPNQRSIVVLSIFLAFRAQHERGEDEVEREDRERRAHHGTRRRAGHALGRG